MEELNVKVGDIVLFKSEYLGSRYEKLAKITRITPTGRIKIDKNDRYYNRFGIKIGKDPFEYCEICQITEDEIEAFKIKAKKSNTISKAYKLCTKIDRNDIDYEKAVKIIELLEENEQ